MAQGTSVLPYVLNFNKYFAHVDKYEIVFVPIRFAGKISKQKHLIAHVKPYKRVQGLCPICMKKCPGYDHKREEETKWRTVNLNGIPTFLSYRPARIECKEHGVRTEYIPWSDSGSRFTPDFNNEIAYLVCSMSKSHIAEFMGINWRTVGNCVKAAQDRIEPDLSLRIRGLRKICVDETSYKSGHSYITVVYDMDKNRVVWVYEGHGKGIFTKFCKAVPEEERPNIEIVAGDGAKWIDECTKEYFPNATRCVDFFHVVSWANEQLDKVRSNISSKATKDYARMKQEYVEANIVVEKTRKEVEEELAKMPSRGRPSKRKLELLEILKKLNETTQSNDSKPKKAKRGRPRKVQMTPEQEEKLNELDAKIGSIKGLRRLFGYNSENCLEDQADKIKLIETSYPDLYKSYQQKEALRVILRTKNIESATLELDHWIQQTKELNIKPMVDLADKILRHRENILNSIKLQANSAKSEATNTTIKVLINMARGFRNLDNMFALIYLKCSNLVIPLNNRNQLTEEEKKIKRDKANERRKQLEENRRNNGNK